MARQKKDRKAGVRCDSRLERELHQRGFARVAGADEAGRGSLFGPVFAAAVVLDGGRPIAGLADSKTLDAAERERLANLIRERAAGWAVAASDAGEIDRLNIYEASRLAMRRAVESLDPAPDYLLVDAMRLNCALPQQGIVRGDARVRCIAAASILAKVSRDACLEAWASIYPEYGLERHKGYATREHLEALARLGPTPLHRLSYRPVRRRDAFCGAVTPPPDGQRLLFACGGMS